MSDKGHVSLILLAVGVSLLLALRVLRRVSRTERPEIVVPRLRTMAHMLWIWGIIWLVVTLVVALVVAFATNPLELLLFSVILDQIIGLSTVVVMIVLLFALWVPALIIGKLLSSMASQLASNGGGRKTFEAVVTRWLAWLFILLGIAVALPGALLPAFAIPAAILLMCHLIPLAIGAAIVKRTEQQQRLLFVLNTAVEHHRPLPDEIEAFAMSATSPGEARQLRHLSDLLRAGRSLPESLDAVPDLLPMETVSAIRVAAANRSLEVALRQGALREDARLQARHRRQLGGLAILTPFFARLLVLLCCVTFLMYWIVPKLKVIFEGFNVRLPTSTQILFRYSDYFSRNATVVFATLLIGVLLAVIFRRRVISRLLAFSVIRTREQIAQMLDQLALVAEASLPWRPVVGALAQSPAMRSVRLKLATVERAVEQGENLWESLSRQNLISNSETELLLAAEKVGNLPWTLRLLADRIENRVQVRGAQVTAAAQLVGMLVLAVIVGGICVAIFHPLLRIYS